MPPGLERQILVVIDREVAIHVGIQQARLAAAELAGITDEFVITPGFVNRIGRVVGVALMVDLIVEMAAAQYRTEVFMLEHQFAKHTDPVVDQRAALEVARGVVVIKVVEVFAVGFDGSHRGGVIDRQGGVQGGVITEFQRRQSHCKGAQPAQKTGPQHTADRLDACVRRQHAMLLFIVFVLMCNAAQPTAHRPGLWQS